MARRQNNQLTFKSVSLDSFAPGYYSFDKENRILRAFVEKQLEDSQYDPSTDTYNVPNFSKPIETSKNTPIYNMHTYWSKKPHDAITQYIQHYTQAGDLVLDPFAGSGGTALAALMGGRKAIAIDRSPAATFITKNYCTPIDFQTFQDEFSKLKQRLAKDIQWLYETHCDRCQGKAKIAHTVYSQVFQCPRCLVKVPLFDCVETEIKDHTGKAKTINACPSCFAKGTREEISTRKQKFGSIPVLVNYVCQSGCDPAIDERRHNDLNTNKRDYFAKFDLPKINEIAKTPIPYWFPQHRMMNAPQDQECWGVKWRAGTSNFRTVDELYTKRNLWALAAIKNAAQDLTHRDVFLFALSAVSLALSRMQRYSPDSGFPNMVLAGTYYVPQIGREIEVFSWYEGKINSLLKGYQAINLPIADVVISTSDARRIDIPANSIDYIFTDPPYASNIQYGELNFVWEAWLDLDTCWHNDEIIVNDVRGTTEADWANMMRDAMAECYRVLKPGHWLSLCYHDTSEGTWAFVQDIMAEVGFIADRSDSALFIDTAQKSFNQLTADKVNKRDLIINFRKPGLHESADPIFNGNEDPSSFQEKIRSIIRTFLSNNPGTTKDRIYDEVVSRMVRSGKMEPHNFAEFLKEVADEVKQPGSTEANGSGRWYLKETEESALDKAESGREDAAAKSLHTFIEKRLREDPTIDGIHYSDLFEHYIYTVPTKDKPRRQLQDWLIDYFFKTADGTWRPSKSPEEQKLKADSRAAGTNRRMKRFATMLSSGGAIPSDKIPTAATLAEWIRQAKRTGQYEVGRLLFERGGLDLDRLPEELAVAVQEDYQVCIRSIERSKNDSPKKTQRKKSKSEQ